MAYKITIDKIEEKLVPTREYRQIADTGGEDGGRKFGYVHGEEKIIVTTEVYTQTVDQEVDLFEVISAFNGKN